MIVKLLTEHHLEFLSLTGGCRGSSESTLVKMPHCWKSHALAHMLQFIGVARPMKTQTHVQGRQVRLALIKMKSVPYQNIGLS